MTQVPAFCACLPHISLLHLVNLFRARCCGVVTISNLKISTNQLRGPSGLTTLVSTLALPVCVDSHYFDSVPTTLVSCVYVALEPCMPWIVSCVLDGRDTRQDCATEQLQCSATTYIASSARDTQISRVNHAISINALHPLGC